MAGILKSKIETYEFSLDEMKKLIASDLQVDEENIEVQYVIREVGADMYDRGGYNAVVSVKVTVNKKEEKVQDVYYR